MAHYLATRDDQVRRCHVKRFRPDLWSVDFPRPMMAALTVPDPSTLRLDLDFLTRKDLVGLIWSSEDRWSHPLLGYETWRDYRGLTLEFEWAAGPGIAALDALHGAVLTVEGRDATGMAGVWYVRLANYAAAVSGGMGVRIDFDDLRAGFGPGGPPVFAGDIDRLFLSVVPAEYDGTDTTLAAPISSWIEMRGMRASGHSSVMLMGDAFLPEHQLRMCSGYDDSYHQAPERLVEQWQALGYRGAVTHYVGMSHYPALVAAGEGFVVSGGVCAAAMAWHRALLRAMARAGMTAILSLSFELFDAYAPSAWAQRDANGGRALTGWSPPSTLLSPCNETALGWLGGIAAAFGAMAADEAGAVGFQVGEPWWWVGPSGAPCFYDAATIGRWAAHSGTAAPSMNDVSGVRSAAEQLFLDWLWAQLADACASVREAARDAADGATFVSHLLFYAPQVLADDRPDLRRANMPDGWAYPEWDVLQLEDYEFVVAGDPRGMRAGRTAVMQALGYPLHAQHYFSGFVLDGQTAARDWPRIAAAAEDGQRSAIAEVFVWAWPQVARDGFVWTADARSDGEDGLDGFHDVRFPLALGFEASGGPEFATQIAEVASGHEQRNLMWAQGRLRYDAGVGVRSDADLAELLAFFRARRGQAFAFRFRDPLDWTSAGFSEEPGSGDQLLGVGDGVTTSFALVKHYGPVGMGEERRITRPVEGSVRVALDGVEQLAGWSVHAGGVVQFDAAPMAGVEVRAGFAFDVPVRFAVDRLDVSISGMSSGEIPSVPVLEVRE